MMVTSEPVRHINRILVAFDHRRQGRGALSQAITLARYTRAEVLVLFVEDEGLLRLASLPFAHEIHRASGAARRIDAQSLARQLSRQVQRLQREMSESIKANQISGTVKVVRGQLAEQALAASGETDVIFIDVLDPAAASGTGAITAVSANSKRGLIAARRLAGPVTVLFDGSPAGIRALNVALDINIAAHTSLLVILHPRHGDHDSHLREQAEKRLSGASGAIAFTTLPREGVGTVSELARLHRCRLLIVPAEHPAMADQAGARLLESADCPVVLIR